MNAAARRFAWNGQPISVAQFSALADLMRGPVFRQPSTLYFAEQPGRIHIRRRTMQALYNLGLVHEEEIAPGRVRAEASEAGRALFQNHPLRRAIVVASL